MKHTALKVFAIAAVVCSSVHAGEIGVSVEKYSPDSKLPALTELPSGVCTDNNGKYICNVSPTVAVKWGAGWCRNTKEELEQLIPSVDVNLYINNVKVQNDLISKQYETYQRNKNMYCYTWLVQLKNWKPGASVSLVSKNGEETLYEANIKVK